jgi:hypothetical protein
MRHGLPLPARRPPPALPASPDLREWLPAGHLAWFILDVVDQLDLDPFYRAHRDDGHGHPAYHPKTLLGVLPYAYCLACAPRDRSSGAAPRTSPSASWPPARPDHVTIARFRVRHE